MDRCYRKLGTADLDAMRESAWPEFERFLGVNHSKYEVYRDRLIGMCLCQGAAQHYVDGVTGVKDVDIFFFFVKHPTVHIPHARNCRKSRPGNAGVCGRRRFDLMKKQVPEELVDPEQDEMTIVNYLTRRDTGTSRSLAQQAVVGLAPKPIFGRVIWSREAG